MMKQKSKTSTELDLQEIIEAMQIYPHSTRPLNMSKLSEYIVDEMFELQSPSIFDTQTWLTYFHLNVLDLLGVLDEIAEDIRNKLKTLIGKFYLPEHGAFGNRIGSEPHLISTFVGLLCVALIDEPEVYKMLDSSRIYSYLQSKKLPNGSFISAELAESDLRCVYCAILIANMINIDLKESDLFANTLEFILTCQNFDGGFGSIPRGESHTGYTFCAVACLELMGELDKCNINKLIKWTKNRFSKKEGGFNGRACKLACTCYNYYCGSVIAILCSSEKTRHLKLSFDDFFDSEQLVKFSRSSFDPTGCNFGKNCINSGDLYHLNYVFSGFSVLKINNVSSTSLKMDLEPLSMIRKPRREAIRRHFGAM